MLRVRPITQKAARAYVDRHHRHNCAPRGGVFCVSVVDDDDVVRGVGIAGRPASRMLDDGSRCEITRVCTDGAHNACSMIYGALARAAFAVGYLEVITYTLTRESGASVRAAGFVPQASCQAHGGWSRPSRPRPDDPAPADAKLRWVKRRG